MHISFNLARALSRLFAAASGGSFVQYMVEVTVQEKPDHVTWLAYTALFFVLSLASFITEHRMKPPSRMHPESIQEIREAVTGSGASVRAVRDTPTRNSVAA